MSVGELVQRLGPGALTTIELTVVVWPLAVALAILIALVRVYRIPVFAQAAVAFVEIVRSTPLLLLLFVVFFALPFVGLRFDSIPTAIACLVLNFAAYQAEIVRAGILSVPVGYVDAGRVLGMNRFLMLTRVISPLAFRVVLPPLANSVIELFKATAVVSLVAVHEIVFLGTDLSVRTFQSLTIYTLISIFYISVGYPSSRLMGWLERKVRLPEIFEAAPA